jgi:hypothetical protein
MVGYFRRWVMTEEEKREFDALVAEFGPYDYAMDVRENLAELGGVLLIGGGLSIAVVSKEMSPISFFVGTLITITCLYGSWLSFREARVAELAYYRILDLRKKQEIT